MLKHTGYIDDIYFECDDDYTKDGIYTVTCYCPDRYRIIKTTNGVSSFMDDWFWLDQIDAYTTYPSYPLSNSLENSPINIWSAGSNPFSFQDSFMCVNIAVEEICKF